MISINNIVILLFIGLVAVFIIDNKNEHMLSQYYVPTINSFYLDKNYVGTGESLLQSFDMHKGIGLVSDDGEYIMLLDQNLLVVFTRYGRSWRAFIKFGLKDPNQKIHRFQLVEGGGFNLYDVHNELVEHDGTLRIFDDRGFLRYVCDRNQNIRKISITNDGRILIDETPVLRVKKSNNFYGNRPLPYVNMNYYKLLF